MQDASLWTFISHADSVVKTVLIILVIASVFSWTIILQRTLLLRKTERLTRQFEKACWGGGDFVNLQRQIREDDGDLAGIFHAGFTEYQKLSQQPLIKREIILESSQRAMRLASQTALQNLEQHVATLATIGSTAPYVGLFGTVWGIMSSFQALGGVQQATIAMVAPGISEALIATAVGLFAAIPAVVAYNRFANRIELIQQKYEMFQEELSGILQQQLMQASRG
ncbi:MAG: protein TolQ [Coxiella sp. RIFCSPHIGHO2_12_FULL_42_15]|nr:MAG: protein TolQ [Coxiella sp. RIFCSPHIGHO2_12_FULL_42_15]